MKNKLAGHLPLQDAIARTITEAREKMKLAAEEKEEKSEEKSEKVKKLLKFEKKEHGHIPSEKEEKEEYEKASSIIDFSDPEDVDKLASALDEIAEKLAGDSVNLGGESHQGGQVLVTMNPVGGTQPYKKDKSKSHNVPTGTGMMGTKDNPGAKTAVPTDDHRAPGGNGAVYPAKGVLKTGAAKKHHETELDRARRWGTTGAIAGAGLNVAMQARRGVFHPIGTVADTAAGYGLGRLAHRLAHGEASETRKVKSSSVHNLQNALANMTGVPPLEKDAAKAGGFGKTLTKGLGRVGELLAGGKKPTRGARPGNVFKVQPKGFKRTEQLKSLGTRAAAATTVGLGAYGAKKALEKDSSAVDYILNKISTVENGGESRQGGEQLSNTAPIPSNAGRELIRNKDGIKNVTKAQAKSPRKKELAEVLTEPAMSAAHDSKVNENLRNASKGGVKIAAARAFLQKIAAEGCKCDGAGECRHCKMHEKTTALRGNGTETEVSVA